MNDTKFLRTTSNRKKFNNKLFFFASTSFYKQAKLFSHTSSYLIWIFHFFLSPFCSSLLNKYQFDWCNWNNRRKEQTIWNTNSFHCLFSAGGYLIRNGKEFCSNVTSIYSDNYLSVWFVIKRRHIDFVFFKISLFSNWTLD